MILIWSYLWLNHRFALQIMVQLCSDITLPFKLKKSVLNIIKPAVFSFKKTFSPETLKRK